MNKLDLKTSWEETPCAFCDDISGYELFSHEDYEDLVLATCKTCGKAYLVESHFKNYEKNELIKMINT